MNAADLITPVDGYNPMRWKCRTLGCFNDKARPKVEIFARLFPGRCAMGDIDYEVELNGYHLRMEWKAVPTRLLTGQALLFRSLLEVPKSKNTVVLAAGDPELMHVTHAVLLRSVAQLRAMEWQERDLGWLELLLSRWALWATGRDRWHA